MGPPYKSLNSNTGNVSQVLEHLAQGGGIHTYLAAWKRLGVNNSKSRIQIKLSHNLKALTASEGNSHSKTSSSG